jgi:DNA-binding SARP family transcriptional activator
VQVLELGESRGYDFLFQKGTLLGSLDGRASIPLLREAKRLNLQRPYVDWLLNKLGIQEDDIQVVSYTLRIQMFGPFRVWRGEREVASREWRREDARRLFQLLLTKRHTLLHKEEIMTYLWPNANRDAAARDFKVALNTLLNVLEPGRLPRSPSFFIQRQGPAYYFNLASGFWLDVEQFEGLATRAEKMATQQPAEAEKMLKRALELYEGDYLEGATQDDWCLEERERLIVIYIRAAELLARLMAGRGDYHNCLQLAEKVLSKDNCWEEAYRLQMYCYGKLNNRAMVSRVYQRCLTVLREELGVAPSLKTTKLYERLLQGVVSRH